MRKRKYIYSFKIIAGNYLALLTNLAAFSVTSDLDIGKLPLQREAESVAVVRVKRKLFFRE